MIVRKKEQTKDQPALHDVKGRVTNKEGVPLAGITVRVKGKDIATATNERGEFELRGISPTDILILSGAEVETRELSVNGILFVSVVLAQKVQDLDETLIIGYGTTTRRFSVGSVTKISAKDIAVQPVSNPLATLQGRVPGLVVTNTSGVPGAAIKIQIRGQNSLNPNPAVNSGIPPLDNPLIIIDGVTFAPQNGSINQFASIASPGQSEIFGNAYGGISPLNNINPNDIESIEILRDANETAIYGSRGANGVILITTKKGKAGKTAFNLALHSGISTVSRSMEMMNTSQYLAMRREALNNDGLIANMTPSSPAYAPDLLKFDSSRNVDWKDYFMGKSVHTIDINGSLTGGNANTQFLISTGYHKEGFTFPGDFDYERLSFSSNLNHFSTDKKFSFELSLNYSSDKNNSVGSNNALRSFILSPNYPQLLSNGELVWNYNDVIMFDNPLSYLKQTYANNNQNLIAHSQIGYQLLKGLKLQLGIGYNTFLGKEHSTIPKKSRHPLFNAISYSSFANNNYSSFSFEPQLTYSRLIGNGEFNVLAGGTYLHNSSMLQQVNGSNFPDDELLNSISAAGTVNASDQFKTYKYVGVFGRINYIWERKYILNLNGRRDGSSRFGKDNQFGNFAALGAGWIFSEEAFFKKASSFLSFGKIRLSWGTSGNDNIGDYEYLSRWLPSGSMGLSFNGASGYIPNNHYNPGFSWSLTRKKEVGVELGWWQDRLLINATWFNHRTSNQLVSYQLPNQTGFSGVTANFPAVVRNSGWEFSFLSSIIKNHKFQWNAAFNLTIPQNKLTAFEGLEESSYASFYTLGKSLSTLRRFILLGVDPQTGIYQYQSKNGSTAMPDSETDYFVIGNLDPKYYGGINTGFQFNNISVDIFVEFRKQTGPTYLQQIYLNGAVGGYSNMPVSINDHWRKAGDKTSIQKLTAYRYAASEASLAALYYSYSSGGYGDASYARLKTLGLSYTLKPLFTKRLGLQSCRLYVNTQNVMTITKYQGHDPENMSFYAVPPLRTIVAGISVTF
ncbi:MAG TPA: SusC/RagA family TonB-linked outer membrane protein [Agriterribacter sp.]|nr:SusC/RagA family TonB-linked outer membrane protein [Agriterribacter sp.]